jgi:hypothetical protein
MMKPRLTFMTGFRPVISARQGRMLGSRNPLDGPVFDRLEDAIDYCIGVMADHFDRGLGLSDAPWKSLYVRHV